MSDKKLNIRYAFDFNDLTSNVEKVKSILARSWDGLKADQGALSRLKASLDKLASDFSASGGKMQIPMQQITESAKATAAALDKLSRDNSASLSQLTAKYHELSAAAAKARDAGKTADVDKTQALIQKIQDEITQRSALSQQIEQQRAALQSLNTEINKLNTQSAPTSQAYKVDFSDLKASADKIREIQSVSRTTASGIKQEFDTAFKAIVTAINNGTMGVKEAITAIEQYKAKTRAMVNETTPELTRLKGLYIDVTVEIDKATKAHNPEAVAALREQQEAASNAAYQYQSLQARLNGSSDALDGYLDRLIRTTEAKQGESQATQQASQAGAQNAAVTEQEAAAHDRNANSTRRETEQRDHETSSEHLQTLTKEQLLHQLQLEKARLAEIAAQLGSQSKAYLDQKQVVERVTQALIEKGGIEDNQIGKQTKMRTEIMQLINQLARLRQANAQNTEEYRLAEQKLSELMATMYHTRKQMQILATPNTTMGGFVNMLTGASGALTALTGTLSLFGAENEKAQKIMVKMQGIMSITMGLQSINMMLNKSSAFQVGILGRLTSWWADCKAQAAAATAAQTAATEVDTAANTEHAASETADATATAAGAGASATAATATTAEAGATEVATAANVKHAFSWKAVGIAIKSVPVWGWLIAILAAVATAIGVVIHNLNKLSNAQKAMKDVAKQAYPEIIKEKNALDLLYKTATDTTKAMDVRLAAVNKLKSQFPDYFKKLKDEAILVGKAADEYDRATEAIKRNAIAKGMQAQIDKYGEKVGQWYADHYDDAQYLNDNRRRYQELRAKYTPEYISRLPKKTTYRTVGSGPYTHTVQESDYANDADRQAIDFILTYENRHKAYQQSYEHDTREDREKMEYLQKELEKYAEDLLIPSHDEKRAATEGDPMYYERLMKEAQSRADDHTLSAAERKQARKDYYRYKALYDKSKFSPKDRTTQQGATDIAEQKVSDVRLQQERERARMLLELDRDLEQQRINILQDGSDKRLRQQKLDNQKEMDTLYQKMQDEIAAEVARQKALWDAQEDAKARKAAANGQQYKKNPFSSGNILQLDYAPGDTIGAETMADNVDTANIQLILSKYGLLQDLILERQQKTIDDQAKANRLAMDEYLKDYGDLKSKLEAIDRIYAEKMKTAANPAELMKLQQEYRQAIGEVEFDEFMTKNAALAFGEVDNLSRETIDRLIAELERYRSKALETFDPEKIQKYEQALTNLRKARVNADLNPLGKIVPEYFRERKAAQDELNEAEQLSIDLATKKKDKQDELDRKIKDTIKLVKTLTGVELTAAQVTDGSTLQQTIDAIRAANPDKMGQALADGIENAQREVGALTVDLNNLTEASDEATNQYQQLLEAFKTKFTGTNGALSSISSLLDSIAEATQGILDGFNNIKETADKLGADTSEGSGWDTFGNILEGFNGMTQGASNAIKSLINGDIGGVFKGLTGVFTSPINAIANIHDNKRERAIKKLQKEIEAIERLNNRLDRALESQYSKQAADTYQQKITNNERQIALLEKQIAEEKSKKNTDNDRIQEWSDQIQQLRDEIEDYKQAAIDAVLGEDIKTSIDNFATALADTWAQGAKQAQATKDFVKKMLREMVLEAMKTDLTAPIQGFRKAMAAAMDDNIVTDAERKALQEYADEIARTMSQRYDWATDILKESAASQSGGDRGGYATASQDSVEELSGRTAAMQTTMEASRIIQAAIGIDTAAIRAQIAATAEVHAETRNLQLIAVGHLETIARNTNRLNEMSDQLIKIEENTRGL